jgi:Tfp pilus assembly protein PilF
MSERRFATAVEYLDRALAQRPEDLGWIRFRAQLLQIVSRHEDALRDFEKALGLSGPDAATWHRIGQSQRYLGQFEAAENAFLTALKLDPGHLEGMANLGNLYRDAGRPRDAIVWLSKAVDKAPDEGTLRAMLGAALLAGGEAAKARQTLETAFGLNPYDRTTLAYLYASFCQTDDRQSALELTRPEMFVRTFQRPGSDGESGRADDLDERLARHLRAHPTLEYERASNTTRGGAHTGHLLEGDPGPVSELLAWIEGRVRGYVEDLPVEPTHPYLAWKPADWDVDIWGIVIQPGGFQEAHIHKEGWISGVYYADVPATVQTDDGDDTQGCLELGRPPGPLCGSASYPTLTVRPRPGRLALFPSYLWHRTLPYDEVAERICVAFDIRPKI